MASPDTPIETRKNYSAGTPDQAAGVPMVVGAQPITMHNSIQSSNASMAAEQLAHALGVAHEGAQAYVTERVATDSAEGAVDAEQGITKPNGSVVYKNAQDHVHALASWAVDSDQIGQDIKHQGFETNPDAHQGLEDMNNWLSQQFKDRYNGSSPLVGKLLAPKMQELRDNANKWFQDQQAAQVNQKQMADLKTIAGSALAGAETQVDAKHPEYGTNFDPKKFDYEGLNSNVQSLYKGAQGNAILWGTLSNEAISKGIPSLLTNMPDRWKDGTPTPKGNGDPESQTKFREAVKQAEKQRDLNLKNAQDGLDSLNDDAWKAKAVDIAGNIAGGKRQDADIQILRHMPGVDFKTIEALDAFQQSSQHSRISLAEAQANWTATQAAGRSNLDADIITGKLRTAGDIVAASQRLGLQGVAANEFVQRGLKTLGESDNVKEKNPDYMAGRDYLDGLTKPQTDILGNLKNPIEGQMHSKAMAEYRDRVIRGGEDSFNVSQELAEKYKRPGMPGESRLALPNDRAGALVTAIQTNPNALPPHTRAFDVDGALATGSITKEQWRAAMKTFTKK
jgi:hypothetical protein